MEQFANYLISRSIVPQKQVPYYIGWVNSFFRSLGRTTTDKITFEEVDRFIKALSGKREDWQVRQAEEAIRIFLYYLRKNQRPVVSDCTTEQQWKIVSEEMRNMLRLKQKKHISHG